MKLIADLHTHTVASTHAFNTMNEMMTAAKEGGMQALAVTDHAPAMPDGAHKWHFYNYRHLQNWHDGFLLLYGAEVNVMDVDGTIDLADEPLEGLDWVIASMHQSCIKPMGFEETTACWLKVAENPHIDMIGHSEQRNYPYDYDRVTKVFRDKHKVVEMNGSSILNRPGGEGNMRELALACKRNGCHIAVNSDGHSIYDLFNQGHILDMLEDIDFPEELVVNASMEQLLAELKLHGRTLME